MSLSQPASPAKGSSGGQPSSPTRSVDEILAEKRAAAAELQKVADTLHTALLAKGIDVTAPPAGQTGSKVRLPLQFFDNLDLESNTPDAWVKLSRRTYGKRPNAILRIVQYENGGAEWMPGRVSQFDAKTSLYTAAPSGVDGKVLEEQTVKLPRLSVMFLSEKPEKFAVRVGDAYNARNDCEAQLLLSFYVKNMPTADVRTLNEMQVTRLLDRSLTTPRLRASDIDPNGLLDEVKLDYAHAVNGMLLREGLQRPPLKDKLFAASLLPPPPPPVPELGVIAIDDNSHAASSESFYSISSLVMPQVVVASQATRNECLQLERLSLFNLGLTHTVQLDDFEQLQSQHTIRTTQFITESWQTAIKKVVVGPMADVDADQWDTPPPPPSSFADYDDDDELVDAGGGSASAADDLLAASLIAAGAGDGIEIEEAARPDTRAFRMMRVVNLMMADAIRYMAQDSMRSYCQFLEEAFSRRDMLTDPPFLPYIPLFSLDVKSEFGKLSFSDAPQLFPSVAVKLLDDAIGIIGEVMEIDLFDKSVSVPLTLHPLSTVSPVEDEVLELREKLNEVVTASLEPLEEYLSSLREHEELLGRDEGAYVRTFEEKSKEPPTLEMIREEVELQRSMREELETTLPTQVLIGTFLVSMGPLKAQLLAKFDKTGELLMRLICDRGRQASQEVSTAFAAMYERLQEQPKDIEKLTEISEFMETLAVEAETLQEGIDQMTEFYEVRAHVHAHRHTYTRCSIRGLEAYP